jgi:Cu2+-exporting ATPase
MDCAACVPEIEGELEQLPGIGSVRVNLTGKSLRLSWPDQKFDPARATERLAALGYEARPYDGSQAGFSEDERQSRELLQAVAISGFAAANIMLLSVSVWSGADQATRDLFHWLSAMIALPTVIYAGRPFFRSAALALSAGRFNMDVPISLAVCLAALMSLFETFHHGETAYFDASVTLLFFLLTGRYLDHLMRARARTAVSQLVSLGSATATVINPDGSQHQAPVQSLKAGMKLLVAAGARFPADGNVIAGDSRVDRSLVTGESLPERATTGTAVNAGMMNLTGPLTVQITATGEDTFLAEVIRLMSAAEQARSTYIRIADRLARIYSPGVHILAAATLTGWLIWTQGDWHASLMAALAVLIITCPCALGLAVPAVQIVASGVMFRNGILVKDGAALEKLSAVDTVVFDKTGTLTLGRLELEGPERLDRETLAIAAGLAQSSRHPLSCAIVRAARKLGLAVAKIENIADHPGEGLTGTYHEQSVKLGSRAFCGGEEDVEQTLPELALKLGNGEPLLYRFADRLRPQAAEAVRILRERGLDVQILSGDREAAVGAMARQLGVDAWRAGVLPQEKLAHVEALMESGRKVLMIGDGLNDAPALAAGFTSIAPSSASDIGRTASDTVLLSDSLMPVVTAIDVSTRTQRLALQNFGLAIGYNVLAVPVAMLGYASPLVAAIAMSTSSVLVIGNALRLGFRPIGRAKFAQLGTNLASSFTVNREKTAA